jgi:hypothetical protein
MDSRGFAISISGPFISSTKSRKVGHVGPTLYC